MAEPYLAEIRMFAGNFAPAGWARCDGQLLAISQNPALFSLMGTTFGGDGEVTFGLPDLRGRIPIHAGSGPGLSNRQWGEKAGTENAVLTSAQQLPPHSHLVETTTATAASVDPTGKLLGNSSEAMYRVSGGALVGMRPGIIEPFGNGQSHANLQPFFCINFIIALFGFFPSQ
jgi:microcystin-dependent protein